MKQNKPNVFVAGFPRCGSEYLFRVLRQHPDIDIPEKIPNNKEISFHNHRCFYYEKIDRKSPYNHLGFEWYNKLFNPKKKIKIDMTIKLAYDNTAPERIRKLYGNIPIIFIVRKKEDWIKSFYRLVRLGHIIPKNLSFNEFLSRYSEEIEFYSDFDGHIKNWKECFSNVLIVSTVDNDTREEVNKILDFLNLDKKNFNFDVFQNKSEEFPEPKTIGRIKHKLLIAFPKLHQLIVKRKLKKEVGK